ATTYQEAVNDENIDRHDKKTDKYNSKGAKEKFEDLKKLHEQIEELQKKPNPTAEEKAELTKKKEEYNDKLKQAKKDTIENIQGQLAQNKLRSKNLGLHNNLLWGLILEIIFKLVIIEIILIWINYSEAAKFLQSAEKIHDPHLSVEEREQVNEEIRPLLSLTGPVADDSMGPQELNDIFGCPFFISPLCSQLSA
ncbi:18244_t:CDS:2, partial [Cetraspora pellucida]